MFFHREENETIGVLLKYQEKHPAIPLIMSFPENDSYVCMFLTAFEDETDTDVTDPAYDEYHTIIYDVLQTLKPGPNLTPQDCNHLSLNYRHFPSEIMTTDGVRVYVR